MEGRPIREHIERHYDAHREVMERLAEEVPTLSWAEGESAAVPNTAKLDELLDELDHQAADGRPFVATLERPDGKVLGLTVGDERSIVTYMASADPPYFSSHDPESDEAGTVVYDFFGHFSESPADAAVPMDDAREAARRFFRTGERPENIAWRMD
jgi:hypothetical protein